MLPMRLQFTWQVAQVSTCNNHNCSDVFWIRNKSLHIFIKYLFIAFFKQDNAINKCYVWIKKIMPNLLFNKLAWCRYLENTKKHAPKGEGRGGGALKYIWRKLVGLGLRKNNSPWEGGQGDFLDIVYFSSNPPQCECLINEQSLSTMCSFI